MCRSSGTARAQGEKPPADTDTHCAFWPSRGWVQLWAEYYQELSNSKATRSTQYQHGHQHPWDCPEDVDKQIPWAD